MRDRTHNTTQTRPVRRGFTLIEMLVVAGIIVLALAMAMPLFNALSGARSLDAARNQIGALLGAVRTDAMGLQRPAGIMFFVDPKTDRVNIASVYGTEPQPGDDPEIDVYLDLLDRDYVALPVGVSCQAIDSSNVPTGDDRYLGFNSRVQGENRPTDVLYGGVVLFNTRGELAPLRYGFRVANRTGDPADTTAMARLLFAGQMLNNDVFPTNLRDRLRSQFGLAVFLNEPFKSNENAGDFQVVSGNWSAEKKEEQWIDSNSVPLLVNRYSGALIKGE